MILSIGILAHNEARRIEATLRDLLNQSVVVQQDGARAVEIVCVVNGSTDGTADVARKMFEDMTVALPGHVSWRVEELKTAGKVNAWNEYVHRLSRRDADGLVLMDADIRFSHARVIAALTGELENNQDAWASVSLPIKHLAAKSRQSTFDRLSLLQSQSAMTSKGWICGQLYCMRAWVAREIILPRGLVGEDGFLALMIGSDLFSRDPFIPCPDSKERVTRPAGASHQFEAYTRSQDLFRQGRRQAITEAITEMLRKTILTRRGTLTGVAYLRKAHEDDPDWFVKEIDRAVRSQWWVMRRGMAVSRWKAGMRKVKTNGLLAVALAFAGFSYVVLTQCSGNAYLKWHRRSEGVW